MTEGRGKKWLEKFWTLPFWRIVQLLCPDWWHLKRENRKVPVSEDEESWIKSRDGAHWCFSEKYLESLNTRTLQAYDHVVQKSLALAGWFGILFVAISAPITLMKDSVVAAPKDWPAAVRVLLLLAVALFCLSLFGVCRVLSRFRYIEDSTRWFLKPEFMDASDLRAERILELIERVPTNQNFVAVKARLYQGAVWSFFASVLIELVAVGLLFASPPSTIAHLPDCSCKFQTARVPQSSLESQPTLTATASATVVPSAALSRPSASRAR